MMALLAYESQIINFAICWKKNTWYLLFILMLWYGNRELFIKSAGNRMIIRRTIIKASSRSSETTRGTAFDFRKFNSEYQANTGRDPVDPTWLEWFVGFVEGDGSIVTNRHGNWLRCQFVITQKERSILDHIQSVLGFGRVKPAPQGDRMYYRYVVSGKANIFLLALLFNGNLVIPHRISQLKRWVDYFGDIQFLSAPVLPGLNDA